jgi:hypothetical protein
MEAFEFVSVRGGAEPQSRHKCDIRRGSYASPRTLRNISQSSNVPCKGKRNIVPSTSLVCHNPTMVSISHAFHSRSQILRDI